jgi:hypothetical protein
MFALATVTRTTHVTSCVTQDTLPVRSTAETRVAIL